MRATVHDQLHLMPAPIAHVHARELAQMSVVIDELAGALELVHADLVWRPHGKTVSASRGREGMTADQVLRAMVVKQMNQFSYDELAFHLSDSNTYRSFCRIGFADKPPTKSRLQKNIKRVRAATWETINRKLVLLASAKGLDGGERVRTDCTVVESNIHAPTDSTLLWDGVRVLVRLMDSARKAFGIAFNDHSIRAKRRTMGILNAKSNEQRLPLYRDLLSVTDKTLNAAERVAAELDEAEPADLVAVLHASGLALEIRHYLELTKRVVSQTQRRVLGGESVPATEKIVSIFEPHTDIIVKDRRETLYGHKVCLTAGASGLVLDVVVEHGNPADATLAQRMVERQRGIYGKVPRQISFDGGFTSRDNLTAIKALGVEDVAFSKGRGLSVLEMVKDTWVYRSLRNFRAGIEGIISFLKRSFGLDRCAWSSFESFNGYVCGSVLACNLLVVARRVLAAPA
jgi:IS5 family transposase